jgi:L-2-hydroxyglutarate oxidase
VAVNESEIPRLNNIYERGVENGLEGIKILSAGELKEFEPHSTGVKAIHVPQTGIIDFKTVAAKCADIISTKAEIKLQEKVTSVKTKNGVVDVASQNRSFTSKVFVNCCGLQSDEVARLTETKLNTRIIPFRGEYYQLKPEKRHLIKNLIYPVPDPAFPFLGVHFTRMISGDIEAGPNAVLSLKKEGYTKSSFSAGDSAKTFLWGGFYKIAAKHFKTGMGEFYRSYSKAAFVKSLQRLVPEIEGDDLISGGAGVRAQAVDIKGNLVDDFLIHETGNVVNVLNAPSPAATSSLAIGEHIAKLISAKLNLI